MGNESHQQLKFKSLLEERAQFMRRNPTDTERALWAHLSGKKLRVAFKRQQVIDRFIVDFVAPSIRLVVEVDGGYHVERATADARRTRVLQRLGYRVVRVEAELVRINFAQAVERVKSAVQARVG